MKILLVKPKTASDHIQPPLGLAYLAKALAGAHDVTLIDEMLTGTSVEKVADIAAANEIDVVGLQCYSHDLQVVRSHLSAVKERCPEVKTVLGGPHPTLMPEDTMAMMGPLLDFILRGEAEESLPELLDALGQAEPDLSRIQGLVYRQGDSVVTGVPRMVPDLNRVATPAWDLIPPESYPPAQHGAFFKNFPIAPIITTRGCPFRCSFCSATLLSGKRIRKREVTGIIDEIKLLHDEHGVKEFHIIDDNFSINRKHAFGVLEEICKLDFKISLAFPNGLKVETITPELLSLMRQAGTYLLSLGIESGSDRILKMVNKNLSVDLVREKCQLIHEAGLDMAGFFVLGFPTETPEEIERTVKLSLELPLLRANYFSFLPLPGTDIYRELMATGELEAVDWENFSFTSAPYVPSGITREELRSYQRRAFIRFYFLRPKTFFRNVIQIRSPRHFYFLSKRFYRWLVS